MREIESDGFITREEDLMKSEPLEQIERANTCMTGNATAQPIKWCIYPKCEECHEYVDEYCTVPMVITKQIYHYFTDEIVRMDKDIAELKNLVYDEILGEGEDFVFDYDPQAKGIGDHTQPIYVGYYVPSRREDK